MLLFKINYIYMRVCLCVYVHCMVVCGNNKSEGRINETGGGAHLSRRSAA